MTIEKRYIFFILISLCFLLYANSLNNEFVSDDIPAIQKEPFITHPLRYWLQPSMFLNSLNYLIAKTKPPVYHLTNIILHSINTILIFYFLGLFFKTEASFLGASLFAAHPVHSEAVTWISGRPYAILSLFILGVYFLYQRSTTDKSKGIRIPYYILSLFIFSYFLWNNFSFYFVFPFFLSLSDLTFGRWRNNWKWWLPFLAIVILRIITVKSVISERTLAVAKDIGKPVTSWTNPFFNLTYSFFQHLGLLLWPAKLTLYHEPPVISAFALKVGIISLVFLLISLPFIFKKARELFFAIGIFVLFLAPTYSPVTISWLVAERYLYFPSIVLSIFLAFFFERLISRSKRFRKAGLMLIAFIIASLAVRTVARNEDWKTQERFWRQTVLVSPNSPRSHNNLADVYSREGNVNGAIRELKKAIELKANYADAFHNLATVYYSLGNLEEAIKFYQQALRFNPELFESHLNLGLIYLSKKEYGMSEAQLEQAIKLRPQDKNALLGLDMARKRLVIIK